MKPWTPLALAGLLAFALPPAASADPLEDPTGLSASCLYDTKGIPDSSDVFLDLAGEATAPGAVATRVACQLLDPDGNEVLALDFLVPGSAAAGAATTRFEARPLTVCTSATAYYVDGSVVELPRECEVR